MKQIAYCICQTIVFLAIVGFIILVVGEPDLLDAIIERVRGK